jgi:cell wall-associated NlpC family hydrolase
MTGLDVIAVKRALSRAGFMQWGKFTNVYGPFAVKATKAFQKSVGLDQDGVYGSQTHSKLRQARRKGHPSDWAFDSLAAWQMAHVQTQTPEEKTRAAIVATAFYGYSHRGDILYRQYRPVTDTGPPPNVPGYCDCSSFAEWCYKSAGAPDPGGHGWGFGNTWTMQEHGRSVTVGQLEPGDLVFYSRPDHVGVYVGAGRVIEHGSNRGPLLVPTGYRTVTACRSYL